MLHLPDQCLQWWFYHIPLAHNKWYLSYSTRYKPTCGRSPGFSYYFECFLFNFLLTYKIHFSSLLRMMQKCKVVVDSRTLCSVLKQKIMTDTNFNAKFNTKSLVLWRRSNSTVFFKRDLKNLEWVFFQSEVCRICLSHYF